MEEYTIYTPLALELDGPACDRPLTPAELAEYERALALLALKGGQS